MKKSFIWSLILLMIVAALYRIIPNRPFGFAPHLAMALFGGAIIKDKKWAFAVPLFSIFLSDVLYEVLYLNGLTNIAGFYHGQLTNYMLIGAITCIAFLMKRVNAVSVVGFSLLTATFYFLTSNFLVWLNGGGYGHPKTWTGLIQTLTDGLPFYKGSLAATLVFSAILFGGYYLLGKPFYKTAASPNELQ